MRPTHPQDWAPVPIEIGHYANAERLAGFRRRDGLGGNALHPVHHDADFEEQLTRAHAALRDRYPTARFERRIFRMPYSRGTQAPSANDYVPVDAPQPLTTTSVTLVMVPQAQVREASASFAFQDDVLPTLRERLLGRPFRGFAGNLGYYMTAGLIDQKHPWSHNKRYPRYPLPRTLSYLGFHMTQPASGEIHGAFHGAHPAAVGIRTDGTVDILPRLEISGYEIVLGGQEFSIEAIDNPLAAECDVALFTPACQTAETQALIAQAETTGGQATDWQAYAPMVPLADAADRVHVLVANRGNGQMPVQEVVAVWDGAAPLPSFGAVLSFKRACFCSVFGSVDRFTNDHIGTWVRIVPTGATLFCDYSSILGGLIPAVIDGQHLYCAGTVSSVMQQLSKHGNALSPIARAGRESRNFDPYVREPAGLLVRTASNIGWVLLDGRHELSIGASIVDAAQILHRLQKQGLFGEDIEQAVFIDGGSAAKIYYAESNAQTVDLCLLNRVAAGSRNGPGNDPDGLNLYTLLTLAL